MYFHPCIGMLIVLNFQKGLLMFFSRYLSSGSSVNRFLKQRVFSTVFRLFYNWAVFLKNFPFCDVAETVCFFPSVIQKIGKRFLISIKSRRKRLEVSRSLENFTYKCK